MSIKPGTRLRSAVCDTEVIVVAAPKTEVTLTCGGSDLIPITEQRSAGVAPAPGLDTGSLLGKRYTSETDDSLEILVTKAGAGTLADGAIALVLKQAKALPSSD